jgi:hypothetical protein
MACLKVDGLKRLTLTTSRRHHAQQRLLKSDWAGGQVSYERPLFALSGRCEQLATLELKQPAS